MEPLWRSFGRAFQLIVSLDPELYGIIALSLEVSGLALALASLLGVPVGVLVGLRRFPGREAVISVLNSLMGLPPVVVGLGVYLLFSRSGPLGFFGLLFTPWAMVVAQTILAFPIVAALSHAAVMGVDPLVKDTIRSLGATPRQSIRWILAEARYGLMAAVIAALGRVLAEVGAVLMVGGNIAGYTRVMTTAIALETSKGDFELALALGVVLLLLALGINLGLRQIQKRGAWAS